ncbi:MAG: amidophosphoribosyltransferase, partial [Clostridiales bacterium]|nr:amidophosphoribosyltransferase [Clostridiales bacterium]
VAALINTRDSIPEGIRYAQSVIDGSMSLLVMTSEGIYAARDIMGRTPIIIGKKEEAFCASFESFAFLNLGYEDYHELGPGEAVYLTPESCETVSLPLDSMKMCTFLWVYYGYPSSVYEGMNVEQMRNNCGMKLAERDNVDADSVAGVPDSGVAHAIGYANRSHIPFSRPFIKYTPTWPRSFIPSNQVKRSLIARMKLIPVDYLIRGRRLILIDDSIVRGTQLKETTEYLYHSGAKEVQIRTACPPVMFRCKYHNFSRSASEMDLIARRKISLLEGDNAQERLKAYTDPDSPEYEAMVEEIRKELHFTTLKYQRLDDMLEATGLPSCKLCRYCWTGIE